MKVNPEDLRAWYLLAQTYERQSDLPGAVKVYQNLLKDDPQNFEAYFRIAQLYRAQKRLAEAAAQYQTGPRLEQRLHRRPRGAGRSRRRNG